MPPFLSIRSRGYWDIHIRPVTFQRERVPLPQLRPLLIRESLNYRSWEFPYITPQMPEMGNDWIGLEHQKEYGLQAWRFFQSGHFAAEVGFLDDWEDKLTYSLRGGGDWVPGVRLSILDVIFRLIEIFGLASRLATTDVYRDERSLVADATLCKVGNRTLYDHGGSMAFQVAGASVQSRFRRGARGILADDLAAICRNARYFPGGAQSDE